MSLLSLSRRDLLTRAIATGVGGITFSTFCGGRTSAQSLTDPQQLRYGIEQWNDALSAQPLLIKNWMATSEFRMASKNEFTSQIDADWANDWVVSNRSNTGARCNTLFGKNDSDLFMGVEFHPWMHIDGYHPNRTLNTVEMAALDENKPFFEQTLNFFKDGRLFIAPFPDTPRLRITSAHEDTFVRIVRRANQNPDNYHLHYARYYVMAWWSGSRITPRPILAHAYTLKTAKDIKVELRIAYTTAN
jgi:hypothetical protein